MCFRGTNKKLPQNDEFVDLINFAIKIQWKDSEENTVKYGRIYQTDNKLSIVETNFSISAYKELLRSKKNKLRGTARNLLYFIIESKRYCNIEDLIKVYFLDGPIKKKESGSNGIIHP